MSEYNLERQQWSELVVAGRDAHPCPRLAGIHHSEGRQARDGGRIQPRAVSAVIRVWPVRRPRSI